ncbi:MAG: site-specific DNA-methyltransferase [Treponema sp.]|nr:site-specific DNA-methyltransferase [Treponema sp.]
MNNSSVENWQESDINTDSLWLLDSRGKSGKHTNLYHGNFIPQIPNQLIRRYSKKKEVVLELFSGSGTTLFECEQLNRNYIGFDINKDIIKFVKSQMKGNKKIKFSLHSCDVADKKSFDRSASKAIKSQNAKSVQFLLAHPPYMDIVKFTELPEDLSSISDITLFLNKIIDVFKNALFYLDKDRYFAVVMGDVYKKSEVIPLGFCVMNAIKQNFKVKLKGIVVKNIEGNRGKIGAKGIWRYRALKSDYFLFKHEYIFVFKKEF